MDSTRPLWSEGSIFPLCLQTLHWDSKQKKEKRNLASCLTVNWHCEEPSPVLYRGDMGRTWRWSSRRRWSPAGRWSGLCGRWVWGPGQLPCGAHSPWSQTSERRLGGLLPALPHCSAALTLRGRCTFTLRRLQEHSKSCSHWIIRWAALSLNASSVKLAKRFKIFLYQNQKANYIMARMKWNSWLQSFVPLCWPLCKKIKINTHTDTHTQVFLHMQRESNRQVSYTPKCPRVTVPQEVRVNRCLLCSKLSKRIHICVIRKKITILTYGIKLSWQELVYLQIPSEAGLLWKCPRNGHDWSTGYRSCPALGCVPLLGKGQPCSLSQRPWISQHVWNTLKILNCTTPGSCPPLLLFFTQLHVRTGASFYWTVI